MRILLTLNFSDLGSAFPAVDHSVFTLNDGPICILLILETLSNSIDKIFRQCLMYLVLTKSIRHMSGVSANLNINGAENTESLGY